MTTSVAAPAAAQQPAGANSKDFRYDIGGLRGLAILFVVIGHVFATAGAHLIGGVDMSFALSGYLITWLAIREFIKRDGIRMLAFYGRRARRLLPAATLVTVTTLIASWQWLSPLKLREIAGDAVATSLPVPLLNYRLGYKATDYFATDHVATTPFQHYWSLNVEEQFYLVYPVLLLLALVIGRKIGKLRLTVGIMLAVIVAVSLTWSVVQTGTNRPMAYFGAHTRAWELALGALVAVAQPLFKRLPRYIAAPLGWVGIAVIFASISLIVDYPLPGYLVGVPVVGTLLVIIAGESRQHMRMPVESVLRFRPLQYIGKISYQWYLWHWPVLIILPAALGHNDLRLADMIIIALGSLVLAAATWHLVDSPIRKVKAYNEKPGKAVGLGVHLMIASIAASLVTMFALAPASSGTPGEPSVSTGTGVSSFAPLTTASQPVSQLPRLIGEGTKLKRLPSDIKSVLPNIEERDGVNDCLTSYDIVQVEPCTIGDTAATTSIVVLGDSHAREWKQALDALGKRRGIKVVIYAKQSCPAEPYVHIDPKYNTRYTQCEKWRDTAYQQIEAMKPKAIILSSLVWDDLKAAAIANVTKRFLAQGIKVVALGNAPRPSENMPECLSEHENNVQACTQQRSKATYRPDLREIRREASVGAGAMFIDPMSWFCTATKCPAVINNISVYADGYHMSGTYAAWISPKLEAALAPVLQ